MSGGEAALRAHLKGGATEVCRAWILRRRDGVVMGFTDHDRPLEIDGVNCRPDSGLTALALEQSTGLSVDNTEAIGALSDAAISEADLDAGRFDGAEIEAWLVQWSDPAARELIFRGHLGEIRRAGGGFRAELRGLAEHLNRPVGRVFQKACTAVLGDAACRFDIDTPGHVHEGAADAVEAGRIFRFDNLPGFDADWFAGGRLEVIEGPAKGLWGTIKRDDAGPQGRIIELWEPIRGGVAAGVRLRLRSGCDKRFETCRLKFANAVNFQGFPDLPEDGWVMVPPARAGARGGGSRR